MTENLTWEYQTPDFHTTLHYELLHSMRGVPHTFHYQDNEYVIVEAHAEDVGGIHVEIRRVVEDG